MLIRKKCLLSMRRIHNEKEMSRENAKLHSIEKYGKNIVHRECVKAASVSK